MVRLQQSAQTLAADDLTLMAPLPRLDDPIEAQVNPLVAMVLEILGQHRIT
jgi:hypothetical protein